MFARLALALALTALLAGCGYGLASDLPTVLGGNQATLRLSGVEQPTMFPWVTHTVRSAMRNEINARNLAVWVDGGNADYNMHIKVDSFTMRSSVSGSDDQTLIYTGAVSLTASIHGGPENSEVWRQTVTYSNDFDSVSEEEAGKLLFKQAVRRVADSMRNTF